MADRIRTKGQTMILETLHRKLRIDQHATPLQTGGEIRCSVRVHSSYSTSGHCHVNLPLFEGVFSTNYWHSNGNELCTLIITCPFALYFYDTELIQGLKDKNNSHLKRRFYFRFDRERERWRFLLLSTHIFFHWFLTCNMLTWTDVNISLEFLVATS